MSKNTGAGKKKQPEPDAIDEVEELLKLTEDDLLLKLSINSHIKSNSNSNFNSKSDFNPIDPDLDRRFQALRSNPNPKTNSTPAHEDVDTLFARFAALKTTPSASNSTSSGMKTDSSGIVDVEEEVEEDEVQKIINWAKDAARLDPSPSSEIDDDDDDDNEESDDDDDGDESDDDEATHTVAGKKKGSKK